MSRTRPPKAVRSIFYIHSRRRYDPGNNPMNFLAIYVTKMLDHNTFRKRIQLELFLYNDGKAVDGFAHICIATGDVNVLDNSDVA